MEESEKRKERMKAIRVEAAEAGDKNEEQNSIGGTLDHGFTNPLIETPSASSGMDEPRPRFDYTDPMAAFSANNKRTTTVLRFHNRVIRLQVCYFFKSRLQEYTQKVGLPTTVYETIKEGPSHEPTCMSTVIVGNVRYDSLPGFYNRKAAEQSAA